VHILTYLHLSPKPSAPRIFRIPTGETRWHWNSSGILQEFVANECFSEKPSLKKFRPDKLKYTK
jgi:hypothetical protein